MTMIENEIPKELQHLKLSLKTEITSVKASRVYYRYEFAVDGTTIFEGYDYSPSPLDLGGNKRDKLPGAAIVDLLSWLTLQKGDADAEYFTDYTAEQIDFTESDVAEEIRRYCYDYEDAESW